MIRKSISKKKYVFLGVLSIAIVISIYSVFAHRHRIKHPNNTVMPSVVDMGKGFLSICTPDPITKEVVLWEDFKASGKRYLYGIAISVLCASSIGLLMGCYSTIEGLCIVPLSLASKIPPTAMMVVFMVLVGPDLELYLILIVFGTAPILTLSIYQGVKFDVSDALVDKAYTLGASDGEVVYDVMFKQILPRVIEAVRLQLGPAMVYMIAAELDLADVGFGYSVNLEGKKLNMSVTYPYVAFLGLVVLGADYALLYFRKWLCPWFANVDD